MHAGKSYKFSEFLIWTKRNIYLLIFWSAVPVVLFKVGGLSWLSIPWPVVALLGTATAFIVGFKNTQSYNRTVDAQQVWISILNSSRAWGTMSRYFLNDPAATSDLIRRHIGWLTALRYQMRTPRTWETTSKIYNVAYKRFYCVPEKDVPIKDELAKYLSPAELAGALSSSNPATYILSLQSKAIKTLFDNKNIIIWAQGKIHKVEVEQLNKATEIPFTVQSRHQVTEAVKYNFGPEGIAPQKFTAKAIRHAVTSPDGKFLVFSAAGYLRVP